MNPNLQAICEKYNYNLPSVVDVILNRYIKEILKELSQTVPSLAVKVRTKLTMKQKKQVDDGKITVERNSKGEVMMPRYNCVTTHTARRSGITNMYLTHKYTILQMMHVSGHKTQKTFMDYIKLSSDEIADEIGFFRSFVGWPFSNIKLSTSSFSFKRLKINSFVISILSLSNRTADEPEIDAITNQTRVDVF